MKMTKKQEEVEQSPAQRRRTEEDDGGKKKKKKESAEKTLERMLLRIAHNTKEDCFATATRYLSEIGSDYNTMSADDLLLLSKKIAPVQEIVSDSVAYRMGVIWLKIRRDFLLKHALSLDRQRLPPHLKEPWEKLVFEGTGKKRQQTVETWMNFALLVGEYPGILKSGIGHTAVVDGKYKKMKEALEQAVTDPRKRALLKNGSREIPAISIRQE